MSRTRCLRAAWVARPVALDWLCGQGAAGTLAAGARRLHFTATATPEWMKRAFRLDVLKCARCGSERRPIAAITSG